MHCVHLPTGRRFLSEVYPDVPSASYVPLDLDSRTFRKDSLHFDEIRVTLTLIAYSM